MASSYRTTFLAALYSGAILCSAAPEPYTRLDSGTSGVSIPLFKRGSLTPEPVHLRVADWPAIQRHVEEVDAKYRRGMINWQTNTGELDLWPVAPESVVAESHSEPSEASPSNSVLPAPLSSSAALQSDSPAAISPQYTPSPAAGGLNGLAPAPLGGLIKPVFDQFHFSQKTPIIANTRTKRYARNRRGRKRQAEPLQDMQNDLLWAGVVNIGSDSQSFLIDIDT